MVFVFVFGFVFVFDFVFVFAFITLIKCLSPAHTDGATFNGSYLSFCPIATYISLSRFDNLVISSILFYAKYGDISCASHKVSEEKVA